MLGLTPAHEQSRTLFFQGIEHFQAGRLAEARACFERCQALMGSPEFGRHLDAVRRGP